MQLLSCVIINKNREWKHFLVLESLTETRLIKYVSHILLRAEGNITATHFPREYT